MSRQDPQMKIRLPEELRDAIASAADSFGRSMNAEIVYRLAASFAAPEQPITPAQRDFMMRFMEEQMAIVTKRYDGKLEEIRDAYLAKLEKLTKSRPPRDKGQGAN